MRLGVPRDADPKVVPKLLADVPHEVQRAVEPTLDRLELLLTLGGVSAQREDVLDALLLHLWWAVGREGVGSGEGGPDSHHSHKYRQACTMILKARSNEYSLP